MSLADTCTKIKMFHTCTCWCSFFYSNILLSKSAAAAFKLKINLMIPSWIQKFLKIPERWKKAHEEKCYNQQYLCAIKYEIFLLHLPWLFGLHLVGMILRKGLCCTWTIPRVPIASTKHLTLTFLVMKLAGISDELAIMCVWNVQYLIKYVVHVFTTLHLFYNLQAYIEALQL